MTEKIKTMATVTKSWIKSNVDVIWGAGGQYTKDDLDDTRVPKGGFDTTLTKHGIAAVERGERTSKFHILIPGIGWCDCISA